VRLKPILRPGSEPAAEQYFAEQAHIFGGDCWRARRPALDRKATLPLNREIGPLQASAPNSREGQTAFGPGTKADA
jgi:hypothetical protein